MDFLDNIDQLCVDQMHCINNYCEKNHLRCLAGICIGFLKELCKQQNVCGLLHILKDDLQDNFDRLPINGIYLHNLCQKKCNNQQICRFLHPPWLKYICFDCQNKKCDKKKEGLWHIVRQRDIQEKVYKLYNINDLNPEKFDAYGDCQREALKYNLDKYCIKYFKGICPYLLCKKVHKDWEEIKEIGKFQNLEDQTLKPCIKLDEKEKQYVQQIQTIQCPIIMQKNQLKLMVNSIEQRPQVDIIFILDCTNSMGKWMEAARSNITQIIAEFKKKVQINTAIRIAAVCYKDFSEKNHIKFHDFTVRPEEIEKFISTIKPEGGEDVPEDLQGALDVALKLNICKHDASLLQLFIITDAPCHGNKYHKCAYDTFPEKQDLEEKLQKFVNLKARFFLSFLQIDKQTEIMEEAIKNVVNNHFLSAKITDKQFSDYIVFSLSSTYNKSKSIQENKEYIHVSQASYKKQKSMPYTYNNNLNYQFIDKFKEQMQNTEKTSQTLIFIEKQELKVDNQGVSVKVFKGFDQKNNVHIVIKILQSIVQKYDNNKPLTEKDIKEAEEYSQSKYLQQLIAKQLSNLFNYGCHQKKLDYIPLYYATPFLYHLEKPFKGLHIIYGETFIDIDQNWVKYTNNGDYFNSDNNLTVFSHFTYQYTNQQLIVTDLQGKFNILSDPAIHTYDQRIYDSANARNDGLLQFFLGQHQECSSLCRQLQLNPTEIQKTQRISIDQNSDQDTQLGDAFGAHLDQENLFKLCDNCNALEKLENLNKYEELCDQCKEKQKDQEEMSCKCCRQIFNVSYNFDQVFATVLEYCQDCQNQGCQNEENHCYYCAKRLCLQTIKYVKSKQNIIGICNDAYFYLRQLKCKNCGQNYNFDKLLSLSDYNLGNLQCNCTQLKK